MVQHDSFNCKCGLNESPCSSMQKLNRDECRSECKELDDLGSCEKYDMWDPSACNCECNKVIKHVKLINILMLKFLHVKID